jgi:chemotaxis protein methyltransferase WspC
MTVRARLRQACGLDPDPAMLERALRTRMAQRGSRDSAQYAATLDDAELQHLVDLVVVPESWLFREPAAFAAASRHAQQRLAAHPATPLRILCVPCAGGEEPYSMAIALHEAGIAPQACTIEGVDVSAAAIARARAGRYTRNAFRGAGQGVRECWFNEHDGEFELIGTLRDRVSFSQGSLLDLARPHRYDILFCRNLLIYFDDATAARAIGVLRSLLADDGILFSGSAEVPLFTRHGFVPDGPVAAFALRKAATPVTTARVALPRPVAPVHSAAPASSPPPVAPLPCGVADPLAHARRLADAGQLRAAAAACSALLEGDPGCADAWFLLGQLSECDGEVRAAATHWRRCLYLAPDHYDALCSLALLAEQSGDRAHGAALRARAARLFGSGGLPGGARR